MSSPFIDHDEGRERQLDVLARADGTIASQRGVFFNAQLTKYLRKKVPGASKVYIKNCFEESRLMWAHKPETQQWMTMTIKDSYTNSDINAILARTREEWKRFAPAHRASGPASSPAVSHVVEQPPPASSPVKPTHQLCFTIIENPFRTTSLPPTPPPPPPPSVVVKAEHVQLEEEGKEEEEEGEELAGEEPSGEELAGEELAGEELAGEEPSGEEPSGEEPAGEEPAGEDDIKYEDLRSQLSSLQRDKATLDAQLTAAQDTIAKREQWEADYKKRKCAEVRRERERVRTVEASAKATEDAATAKHNAVDTIVAEKVEEQVKEERKRADRLENDNDQLARLLSKQKVMKFDPSKGRPSVDVYKSLIAEATKQYSNRLATCSQGIAVPGKGYEYEEYGGWTPMPPSVEIEKAFDALFAKTSSSERYIIGSYPYTAKLSAGGDTIEQTNHETSVMRLVRKAQAPTSKTERHTVLFGTRSPMHLSSALLNDFVLSYNFQGEAQHEVASVELAELATLFAKIGGLERTYDPTKTEIYVKPAALMAWLNVARGRKMQAMRLCMHGSDLTGYAAIKADPIGFTIKHQGKNGSAYGFGAYLGFSEHVTRNYNLKSGLTPGTALLCLLLTDENCEGNATQFSTFVLSPPPDMDSSLHNAVVVRELGLILVLGMVVAK